MSLDQIKLAGFKSFVDPTTVKFPSNLTGIVGPNGCGKSNIIDAVRWVMGEGSAKHLRGESMADVIFNGSSGRKPVGQASIELTFDNSDARFGGEYASFSKISVRRTVDNSGQSSYHLNGTRCRRRDILDVFLGTGLGPRSYAIIEQGTISRVIEAKPEELRVHLEEAAGISKYKERRRETETRMRHTQENLDRLSDLRDELDKQLAHLKRQANAAERYKVFKEESKSLKAQLNVMQWQALQQQAEQQQQAIQAQENALQAEIAKLRQVDAASEQDRVALHEQSEQFNQVQSRYYAVGTEIAKAEQEIQHRQERQQQITTDLNEIVAQLQQNQQEITQDQQKITELTEQLAEAEPKLATQQQRYQQSAAKYDQAQQDMQALQQQWDEFNHNAAVSAQKAEVEQTRIHHLEQKLVTLKERKTRLQFEYDELEYDSIEAEIKQIEQECLVFESDQQQQQQHLASLNAKREEQSQTLKTAQAQLQQARDELQQTKGKLASLEELQAASLRDLSETTQQWLAEHSLTDAKRLAQALDVAPGWEKAVEVVLGPYLQGICVDAPMDLMQQTAQLDQLSVTLVGQDKDNTVLAVSDDSLASKVNCHYPVVKQLASILLADDVAQALQKLPELTEQQSIITRDGIWLSHAWVRIGGMQQDKHAGVLARERELQDLQQSIQTQQANVTSAEQQVHGAQEKLEYLRQQTDKQQTTITELKIQLNEAKSQLNSRQQQLRQVVQRAEHLDEEIIELEQQIADDECLLTSARAAWQQAIEAVDTDSDKRENLMQMRQQSQAQLDEARIQAQLDKEGLHELQMQIQSANTQLTSLQGALERFNKQSTTLTQKQSELQQNLATLQAPLEQLRADLKSYLEKRLTEETALTKARQQVEALEHNIREQAQQRQSLDGNTQNIRSQLEQLRIDLQSISVKQATLLEQLQESGFILQEVINALPEGAKINVWQENIAEIERKIQRLGAINLAAIEEFASQSERKQYLDAQHADLSQALETLENAIRKIDRETRTRLQETFETINRTFSQLFPKIFGGGSACLELTGDDLLNAGVAVTARPPGKRNSSIHLLSGGEKALTAIALVFAFFQLNPAPFCMLDEVDAPLDDVNVGRFCEIVKSMSEQVQFVVITHNKVTMEMMNQLMGVTMHEPGVSRMVTVDVESAVALTEEA
jgi:chromosome segregation protein